MFAHWRGFLLLLSAVRKFTRWFVDLRYKKDTGRKKKQLCDYRNLFGGFFHIENKSLASIHSDGLFILEASQPLFICKYTISWANSMSCKPGTAEWETESPCVCLKTSFIWGNPVWMSISELLYLWSSQGCRRLPGKVKPLINCVQNIYIWVYP